MKKNSTVAIITARGGSKRIPRKNLKIFAGRPIIQYSIDAALTSGCFDEVMVSTDDTEIAQLAKSLGAKVPFLRSERTANDFATTAEVIEEVLKEYRKRETAFAYCCCIYPTAPFISAERLSMGLTLLSETKADSVIPVSRYNPPSQWALAVREGKLAALHPETLLIRSQDLEPTYYDCGQFYWLQVASFLEKKKLFTEHTVPIEIPETEVQDIDTEADWQIAEMKFKLLRQPRKTP